MSAIACGPSVSQVTTVEVVKVSVFDHISNSFGQLNLDCDELCAAPEHDELRRDRADFAGSHIRLAALR